MSLTKAGWHDLQPGLARLNDECFCLSLMRKRYDMPWKASWAPPASID
jgi:hypothetical protein